MIAYISLPGSSLFDHFHGTRAECEAWLDRELPAVRGSSPLLAGTPCRIISDKAARAVRYRDGRPVFRCVQRNYVNDEPCKHDVASVSKAHLL